MKLGEFFVALGVNADTMTVRDFAGAIGDLDISAAAAVTVLYEVGKKMAEIANEAMNVSVGFQAFTAQTGLSWQELQKWQIVAEQANVSTTAVASSISNLQRNLAEIRMGRGNAGPFAMLGIDPNQDAFGVIRQLRSKIPGIGNRAVATNLITQMGLSPEMMNVLTMTNTQFERLSKTVAGMTGAEEGSFLKAKLTITQFGQVLRYLSFDLIAHLIDGLQMLVSFLGQFKAAAALAGIALAGLGIYFSPITAAVVALMLILDDLAVYFQGGDSVIGLAIKGMRNFGEEMKKAFSTPGSAFQSMVSFMDKFSHLGAGAGQVGNLFSLNPLMPIGTGVPAGRVFNIFVQNHGNPREFLQAFIEEMKREFGVTEASVDNGGR